MFLNFIRDKQTEKSRATDVAEETATQMHLIIMKLPWHGHLFILGQIFLFFIPVCS